MAAGQGVEAYIHIMDFSKGIASARHARSDQQPTKEDRDEGGVWAQEDQTWGCYGHPQGGLHPLPGIVAYVDDPGDDWPITRLENSDPILYPHAGDVSNGEPHLVINATGIMSPMVPAIVDTGDLAENWREEGALTPDLFCVLYGGYGEAHGNTQSDRSLPTWEFRAFHMARYGRPTTPLLGGHGSVGSTNSLGGRGLVGIGAFATVDQMGFDDPLAAMGEHYMAIGMGSANIFPATSSTNAGTTTLPNNPIGAVGFAIAAGRVGFFPPLTRTMPGAANDDAIVTVAVAGAGQTAALSNTDGYVYGGVSHQNRVTMLTGGRQEMGASSFTAALDVIRWFPGDDLYAGPVGVGYRFMAESPVGYGALASINANEMFMVKHVGGALVMRGDLESPQIISLPGVPPVRGASNVPVVTPLGVVFGTRDGVWIWNGEETAELLSPQLDGCFWLPDGTPSIEVAGSITGDYPVRGKFNMSGSWLYAPNNWVYDLRSNGWFRLSPTKVEHPDRGATYRNYEVSASGRVYAVKPIIDLDDLTVAHIYDPEVAAPTYRYRSQPLARTVNRVLDFREVTIVAEGTGTIIVRLFGLGANPASVVFEVDSPRPRVYTAPFKLSAHDVEFDIEATGTSILGQTPDGLPIADPDHPAPTIYRMSLGYQPAQSSSDSTADFIPSQPVTTTPAPPIPDNAVVREGVFSSLTLDSPFVLGGNQNYGLNWTDLWDLMSGSVTGPVLAIDEIAVQFEMLADSTSPTQVPVVNLWVGDPTSTPIGSISHDATVDTVNRYTFGALTYEDGDWAVLPGPWAGGLGLIHGSLFGSTQEPTFGWVASGVFVADGPQEMIYRPKFPERYPLDGSQQLFVGIQLDGWPLNMTSALPDAARARVTRISVRWREEPPPPPPEP